MKIVSIALFFTGIIFLSLAFTSLIDRGLSRIRGNENSRLMFLPVLFYIIAVISFILFGILIPD